MILKLIFAGAAAALATVGGASAATYDYTTLNFQDGQYTYGQGINNSGAVTGSDSYSTGFVYSGGTYFTIEVSASGVTVPQAITDLGAVAGTYEAGSNSYSFLYSGGTSGTYSVIHYPKSASTSAVGINASSVVAGFYTSGPNAVETGFEYSDGTYTRIKYPKSVYTWVWGIDNAGAAAGYYENGAGDPAWGFVYSAGLTRE